MKHYQTVIQKATLFGNLPFGKFCPYSSEMINDDLVKNRRIRLKQWIDKNFEGVAARLVDKTDINQGELSGLLRDKSFGEKKARSIEMKAGMPSKWLDGIEGASNVESQLMAKPDTILVPLLNAVASMGSGNDQESEMVLDLLSVNKSWAKKMFKPCGDLYNLAFIHAIGDSMHPTFNDGDVLMIDTGDKTIGADKIYVLQAHNRLFIKRVRQRLDGCFEISSDNPSVKTVDVLNGNYDVEILGRVIWVWNGRKI